MAEPFRVSAPILGLKMQTIMSTVALLQFFKIISDHGTCQKCDHKIAGGVKVDGINLYWWCSRCRVKTPMRKGTVLENSNLKLDRFVLLMYSFVNRGSTYQQMVNEACLPTMPGYKES